MGDDVVYLVVKTWPCIDSYHEDYIAVFESKEAAEEFASFANQETNTFKYHVHTVKLKRSSRWGEERMVNFFGE